jgi:outer membrane protein OmpA-like peptidoglycan-associated protein
LHCGEEVTQKQQQNALRRNATDIWQAKFSSDPDGQIRSSIERLSIIEQDQFVTLRLNVFTSKLYSAAEKEEYVQELAQKLGRSPQQIQFVLTEIPTASNEILAKKEEVALPVDVKPSLNELQFNVLQSLDSVMTDLSLPPNVQLLDYILTTGKSQSMLLTIAYLSDRPISADAQALVIQNVKARIGIVDAKVNLEYVNFAGGEIIFEENKTSLPPDASTKLDQIGDLLQRYSNLKLSMSISLRNLESNELRRVRTQAITSYLASKWQIPNERLDITQNLNIAGSESANLRQDGKVLFQFTVKPKEG